MRRLLLLIIGLLLIFVGMFITSSPFSIVGLFLIFAGGMFIVGFFKSFS